MNKIKLNNGIEIPNVGLGTWLIDDDKVANVIEDAVKIGYRHIDTAEAYENEEGVGEGIKKCGIDRKKLFITTKIRAEYKTYEAAKAAIDESLRKLGLEYNKENLEVWKALEDAYNEGKLKSIGVSNFHIEDLQNIIDNCKIKPMVNQVLSHIGQTPFDIIEYCKKNNIVVEAYSPIAHGEADRIQEVNEIAKKYNKTFAQICIKYQLQLGLVALPKATSYDHLMNNFDLDFEITDKDMEILKKVKPLEDYGEHDFFPVFKHSGE